MNALVPGPDLLTSFRPGGCGQSFTSLIVSPQFEKQTSLKRHRLVNAALKDEIAVIHAWSAKCQTPAEFERDRAAAGPSAGPPMDGTVGGRVEGVSQ
jgi:stress-induced morphogen